MKPVRSYQEVLELKRRLYRPGVERDFIFFEADYVGKSSLKKKKG